MYRLHFMTNKWLAKECQDDTFSDLVENGRYEPEGDLEAIINFIDEGTPTLIVDDLEDLPEAIKLNLEMVT